MKLISTARRAWTSAALLALAGCAALLYFPTQPVTKSAADPSIVRGYLAAAVGRSADAERGGLYSREFDPQDIHLPGVTVYLEDAATGSTGTDVRTDLSGRFTLRAPKPGQYRLCWKSPVYGGECLQNSFLAGHEPLFLSTLRIRIAPKKDHVASFGKVRFADDSPARTLEPFADVNAFAVVRLLDDKKQLLAEVPVNNHGEYLLPYLPANAPVTLLAVIEKTETAQQVLPETYIKNPRLVRFHLTLQNTPPRLDAITPVDAGSGKRVQVGAPGQTLRLRAETRDRDGDPVKLQWLPSPGAGSLSATTGNQVDWTLPAQPGRHSVTALASDGRGGYARFAVRLPVGAPGVAFGGVVLGTDGTAHRRRQRRDQRHASKPPTRRAASSPSCPRPSVMCSTSASRATASIRASTTAASPADAGRWCAPPWPSSTRPWPSPSPTSGRRATARAAKRHASTGTPARCCGAPTGRTARATTSPRP